ncbi:riboflavin kinase [Metabacillus rhizolycopersici]|uniref:riboflavin kinase n=1 Tax=Metabacillus rhizolycopersici TaxID=2875709 RepID=A0ABS7UZD1_9BACI|nr:riboflavin kinase [Metabacillus rhizolycopersici]MBZ5753402.1 riboflavin kinase [Metabacillus rhizolycopersici]
MIAGKVIRGNQIGRTIGFPTANLFIDTEDPYLTKGVYGVKIWHKNIQYDGIMNVGVRPTINKEDLQVHYEVHIFNFNQIIYGEELKVDVFFFVREETSFGSINQLVLQIKKDIELVENRFKLECVN